MDIWNRESKLLVYEVEGLQAVEIDMSVLDFDFEVRTALPTKKDGKNYTEPVTCRVDIFKLSSESREKLSADGKGIELHTGYSGDLSLVFRGPIVNVTHRRDNGLDWVTTIYCSDAWGVFSNSFFSRSYSTGERVQTIVGDVADSFGLSVTNEFISTDVIAAGLVLFGKSKTIMDKLARDYDFSWSISEVDGVHVVDNLNPPLIDHTSVEVLTSDVLLHPPSIEETTENKGKKNEQIVRRVHAACILNPVIRAGGIVQFKPASFSRSFADIATEPLKNANPNAFYIVQECIHRGTNRVDADHSTEITTKEETL